MKHKLLKIFSLTLIISGFCFFSACSKLDNKAAKTTLEKPEKNKTTQMVRQETRYTITIKTSNTKYGAKSLAAILSKLEIVEFGKLEIFADKDNKLDIPGAKYKVFITALQRLGKLKVERKYVDTNTPSDSPIPFIIRFKSEEE